MLPQEFPRSVPDVSGKDIVPKLRCTNCKSYVDKRDLFWSRGMVNLCTPECFYEYRAAYARTSVAPMPRKKLRKVFKDEPALTVRRRVLRRDGNCCRYCGTPDLLSVHHIEYRSQGGTHEEHNLITLCLNHHELMHSNKKRYQPVLRGVIWKWYTEQTFVTVPQLERWLDAA